MKWRTKADFSFCHINAFTKEARENRLTNASAEGMNNKIKTMTKIAHGYMNFDRFRKRIQHTFNYKKSNHNTKAAA